MIALRKGNEPPVLSNNKQQWTQVLLDHEANGTGATDTELGRYNHKDIKDALKAETSHKCAYCESKFGHVTYGDIEHITPKKRDARLRFEWSNLTIACDVCNTKKGVNENIIDPYATDPEQQFLAAGPMLIPLPNCTDAIRADYILKLNRAELLERRGEHIKGLNTQLTLGLTHSDPATAQAILDDLMTEQVQPDKEYVAVTRGFISLAKATGLL